MSNQEFDRLERFMEAPAPSGAAPDGGGKSTTISAAFETYCEEKTRAGAWRDPEHAKRYDHGPVVDLLIEVAGDRPMSRVTVDHLRTFKRRVMESSGANATVKKKIQRLRQFLAWAKDHAELTSISLGVLTAPRSRAARKHYEPFDAEDLKAI